MKNLLLVYNPFSGSRDFRFSLDEAIRIFQEDGYFVTLFRFNNSQSLEKYLSDIKKDFFDTIVASGGDGSINIVINAILKNNIKTNLGIIPSGTANDFATYLNIPKEYESACEVITKKKIVRSDVGKINDKYFINVFGAGLVANISQNVDDDFKNLLGKIAYYLKGIEQISEFKPITIRITNSNEVIVDDVFLFLVLNSAGAGSFQNLAPNASISDGVFDFIAIKARPIVEIAVLFVKILKGSYLDDPNVIHFADSNIKVEVMSDNPSHLETDVDGERGPNLPVSITNIKNAINIFIP